MAKSQVAAVRLALLSKVLVITGGPGVGKTTIVRAPIGCRFTVELPRRNTGEFRPAGGSAAPCGELPRERMSARPEGVAVPNTAHRSVDDLASPIGQPASPSMVA